MDYLNSMALTQADVDLLASNYTGQISFGPITIKYEIDLSVPRIIVTVTVTLPIVGTKTIGSVTLDPQHPSATIGGSFGPVTVQLALNLNLGAKQLDYKLTATVFGQGLNKSGVINF